VFSLRPIKRTALAAGEAPRGCWRPSYCAEGLLETIATGAGFSSH
jgi:hypothetical protein